MSRLVRRVAVYSCIVLVLCLLASPLIVGWVYRNQARQVAKRLPLSANVILSDYQFKLGWLHSHEQFNLILKTSSQQTPLLRVESIVRHGPILQVNQDGKKKFQWGLAKIERKILLHPKSKDHRWPIYLTQLWQQPVASLVTITDFTGSCRSTIESFKLDIKLPKQKGQIRWQGLSGNAYFDPFARHYASSIKVSSAKFSTTPITVSFEGGESQSELSEAINNFWIGKSSYRLFGVNINLFGDDVFTFADATVSQDSSIANKRYQLESKIKLPSLSIGKASYAPLNYQFTLEDADADAFLAYMQFLKTIKAKMSAEQTRSMSKQAIKLLRLGAKVTADISINLPEGLATTHMLLNIPHEQADHPLQEPLTQFKAVLEIALPAQFVNYVVLEHAVVSSEQNRSQTKLDQFIEAAARVFLHQTGFIEADKINAAQQDFATKELQSWIEHGILVSDPGRQRYMLRLDYLDHELMLNGKVLNQQQLEFIGAASTTVVSSILTLGI